MELADKPDLDKVLERFEAWWACELLDRPLLTIATKPEGPPAIPTKEHSSDRQRWFDVEHRVDCFEASLEGAVFLAETVPSFAPNLGPDLCATLFGAELEFGGATTWVRPVAASCRDILRREPDLESVCWNKVRELTDESLRRGEGRWLTQIADLHTNGDLLSALRDPGELCVELCDDIDSVRAACDHVTSFYRPIYDDLYDRIAAAGQPLTTWTPILHTGRAYMTSCDFICLISPQMFQEAILPGIVEEMRFLDRSCFHLDGEGSLNHLDALLECEDLHAIAWVYGAGKGPASDWMEVYKKTQAAGKALHLTPENFEVARAMAEQLRPEGVWFWFEGSGPYEREEVEAFVAWLKRWAAGKEP